MTWLFEDPFSIAIVGGAASALLAFGWLQMRVRSLWWLAIAAVLVTAVALLVERLVVTDREQVRTTLLTIADDVETNDLDRILTHVYSQAPQTRQRAAIEFPHYRFSSVSIKSNLDIDVDTRQTPPRAVAQFNVTVVGSTRDGSINMRSVPRFVTVTLYKEDGQWRVGEYAHDDPMVGLRR